MDYKLLQFPVVLLIASAIIGCTDKPKTTTQTTSEDKVEKVDSVLLSNTDWDQANYPMYITSAEQGVILHPYYSSEDSALYVTQAAHYTTLFDSGQRYKISFTEDHKGKSVGNLIGGAYATHMTGLYYTVSDLDQDFPSGFAFTDQFMSDHEDIPFKTFEYSTKAPSKALDIARQHYNGKVYDSWLCAESRDKTVGVCRIQFHPIDSICIGMLLVYDHDTIYTLNDTAYCYDGQYTWHVDDDGVYGGINVSAITRGPKGLDIFCVDYAPESVTPEVYLARGGELLDYQFACYYVYIDYQPSPEAVALPASAKLKAQDEEYRIWVDEEIAPSEDNPMGQYAVYYQQKDNEEYYRIASNSMPEESFKYVSEGNWPSYIGKNELLSCTDAYLTKSPNGTVYLVLEGCPDMRNVFTYISTLPIWTDDNMFHWMPTNAGFRGLDESGELLKIDNYGYNDEGRFNVTRYYDFNWELIRETPSEE